MGSNLCLCEDFEESSIDFEIKSTKSKDYEREYHSISNLEDDKFRQKIQKNRYLKQDYEIELDKPSSIFNFNEN